MNWRWTIGLAIGWMLWSGDVLAQFTGGNTYDPPENYSSEPQGEYDIGPDTSDIYYFFADNPGQEFTFSDSLLGNYFHQQDPARARDLDYAHLGNLGSAARQIAYEPLYRRGFDVGLHQFDLYQTPATEIPYYRIDRAYTNLGAYQFGEQADSYFTGQFSRNFADGFNFSIDYKRISQVGRRNQFPNQNTRNTALGMGLWYQSKGGNYDGFFGIAWNTIEQEDNGGVLVGPETTDGLETPNSAEVYLENARTRHARRGFSYTHYYTFGKQSGRSGSAAGPPLRRALVDGQPGQPPPAVRPDSLGAAPLPADSIPADSLIRDTLPPVTASETAPPRNKRRYTLAHRIYYQSNRYKFFDADVNDPTAIDYYRPFFVDPRGMRFYLEHQQLENTFRLRTFKPRETRQDGARRQRDLLEAGLIHRINWVNLEITDTTINNLFVFGRLNFQPNDRLRINTYAHLGIFDNAGDYRLYGELFFSLGKFGQLTATVNNQLYEPNLMQQRFVVSQQPIWNNDFGKTLETNLTATYSLPQWNLEITGGYHLLNNYIYFDTLATARQTGTPISIVQLIVKKDFDLGAFHLDNVLTLQSSSEDFIRLPDFFTKHSLYYEGKWFGVLNVRTGFDLRLNNSYFAYTYNPVVGQFHLQDTRQIDLYPSVDGFFSMRVTRFRAFVKWENMTSLIIPPDEQLFYQTAFYPFQTGSGLRIGIKWRFVD